MHSESTYKKSDVRFIQKEIIARVAAASARFTPRSLEKTVSGTYGLDKSRARAVLKELVARGDLEYSYEFGSTYLIPAFNKPLRISAHVVILPPGYPYQPAPDDAVIQIRPGAAFGDGRHPTTRLSLNAIDYVLKEVRPPRLNENGRVLDIGTGSGILAIAAVCLGVKNGLGIDIDPCAVAEAGENIVLNHLQDRLTVSDGEPDGIQRACAMVIANLRYPSLKKLYPQITKLADAGGWLVLSGFLPCERDDLMRLYATEYFEERWTADELGWCASVLQRR
jgi:ribosomal protein L11 methyltransferase